MHPAFRMHCSSLEQSHRQATFRKCTPHSACIVFFGSSSVIEKPLSTSAPRILHALFFALAASLKSHSPQVHTAFRMHCSLRSQQQLPASTISPRDKHIVLCASDRIPFNRFYNESTMSTSIVPKVHCSPMSTALPRKYSNIKGVLIAHQTT